MFAQDSARYDLRRKVVIGGNSVAYASTMTGLYQLWYKDYEMGRFHFFNDNDEWLQMDKVGHTYSCYYEGIAGIKMMQWAGYTDKQAAWIGGSYGFLIQSSVEVLDGFSEGWGASWGDMTANAVGSGLAIGQQLMWNEQRIVLKYGYNTSNIAALRPELLGSNFPERIMKDYNAQTYWLSLNIASFHKDTKWPQWLNVAVGYGADGMVGGTSNIFERNFVEIDYSNIPRYRQIYLAPDVDLTRIPTDKPWLRTTLFVLNCIKFPTPNLAYSSVKGFEGHWLSF